MFLQAHFSNTLFLDSKISLNTGNPIRNKVLKKSNSQYLEPGPWPITLLVLGGSQGARLLSDALPKCIETLSKKTKETMGKFKNHLEILEKLKKPKEILGKLKKS